jgi:Tat protein translocase TatB subunit
MFEIGFSEIILIVIVALLVTDPKDLPDMMFKAGRFFRQFKMMMGRISNSVSDVMHEFEVESYRKQYDAKKDEAVEHEADHHEDDALIAASSESDLKHHVGEQAQGGDDGR